MNRLFVPETKFHTPEQLILGEKIYAMLTRQEFGACLSDCYNPVGSQLWDHFMRATKQKPGMFHPYDVAEQGAKMVRMFAPQMAAAIVQDKDIDTSNLILVEKGGGSRNARIDKTLVFMDALTEAGAEIKVYSDREKSAYFRKQGKEVIQSRYPEPDTFYDEQDVDFNTKDPEINHDDYRDSDAPRVVIEFGSSRSNIPTKNPDEIPFEQLREIFRHDRKICRDGGILIIDCDATQDREINESMYSHPAHAKVGETLMPHAQRQGVVSGEYEPMLHYYRPEWEERRDLLKHMLVSAANQNFSVLRLDGRFHPVETDEFDEGDFSNSFKWQEGPVCEAAGLEGFRPMLPVMKTCRQTPRVNGYIFKAA